MSSNNIYISGWMHSETQTARWIHDRSHRSGIPIIAEANVAFGYTWRVWHSDQLKTPGMHQPSREWERFLFYHCDSRVTSTYMFGTRVQFPEILGN